MVGVGFTVIVNVCTGPGQLPAVGVTVNIPLMGVDPKLVPGKDAIALPEPLSPMPIAVLLLFHV